MKIIKLTTLAVVLASALSAGNVAKQSQLSSDMRDMLSAIQEIQKSGFYQDYDGMSSGVEKLKAGLKSLTTTDAKSYLPDDQAYADKFAKKRATMIEMYANDLSAAAKAKDMDEALEDYTQLLKQCTSCHSRIRAW
ncbi:cytochrome c [bacterium]|nr:cytochrome c [bacterium]MBU1989829.1 cytochrome c [bacterium]